MKIRPVGPSCQVEETFFQLNKEELSLRATMNFTSRQALHIQSSSDDSRLLTMLTTLCQAHPDWNDPEMGKRGSGVTDGEEWETSLVRVRGSTAAVPPTGDRSKNRG